MTDLSLPVAPKSVLDGFGYAIQQSISGDMQDMQDETLGGDEKRDLVFKHVRSLLKNVTKIQFAVRIGELNHSINSVIEESKNIISSILDSIGADPTKREGNLSNAIEKFTETRMMQHFFLTGKLVSHSAVQPCNDEEYIGAALGFAQDLSRYVVGRASEGDEVSIYICQELIVQLNAKMLEFDFRNGPLRRKYDGLKYALKNVEDVLYELSLLHKEHVNDDEIQAAKRRRTEEEPSTIESVTKNSRIDEVELDAIRQRMDAFDKLREDVIKQSRDVQKLSKQAVFSVHRGGLGDAQKKLDDAKKIGLNLLAMIEEHPALRNGAFGNSLEEWAEGALTLDWVNKQRITSRADMPFINTAEYVGALSDFTGEIGRLAIASASKRDLESVRKILQADVAIYAGLMQVNVGGKFTKKCEAVATNMKKVEDVVYELSMLQRGARGVSVKEEAPSGGKDDVEES